MTRGLIAVIDIGKTNAKVAFVDAGSGAEVWSAKRVNELVAAQPVRQLDIVQIERWLLESLQQAPDRDRVSAIVPIAHGAAAVLLDGSGAVVAAPDYEDPTFDRISDVYERERDPYAKTFSPSLPHGLNLGRQLYFLSKHDPGVFAGVAHILPYPQYWAWRFSSVMASEVTSLGCHTDLWWPREQTFSALARARNWPRLFPPIRYAGDTLGAISPQMAASTGLPDTCRVTCGLHDSNASYLEHLIDRPQASPCTVISSGTWTVIMASATDPSRLRGDRDMLANVDVRGTIVAPPASWAAASTKRSRLRQSFRTKPASQACCKDR